MALILFTFGRIPTVVGKLLLVVGAFVEPPVSEVKENCAGAGPTRPTTRPDRSTPGPPTEQGLLVPGTACPTVSSGWQPAPEACTQPYVAAGDSHKSCGCERPGRG